MIKQEFERLSRINVTDKTYKESIEPMFAKMKMDKREFAEMLGSLPSVHDILIADFMKIPV